MYAIVTGGSSRTGLEIIKHLLINDYYVYTHYFNNNSYLMELKKTYPRKLFYTCHDLTNIKSLESFIESASDIDKPIDLLINTFGDYLYNDLLSLRTNDLTYMLNSNLIYVDTLIQEFSNKFSKNGGSIINFGYSHGDKIVADTNTTYYHIAKMGLLLLTKGYAKSLGSRHINVNMISPGVLENSIVIPEDIQSTIPMNRLGSFVDIIHAVDFLSKNQYITGNNLIISGGYNI